MLDEARSTVANVGESLYAVVPLLQDDLRRALSRAYPRTRRQLNLPLRLGSWVGGDRDGNAAVTASVTADVLAEQRRQILGRYQADIRDLGALLSVSANRAGASQALVRELQTEQRDRAGKVSARNWPSGSVSRIGPS